MIQREMKALEAALNEESWQWLMEQQPTLAEALQKEVRSGAAPDEVRRFVLRVTKRPALAERLQQAAAYLAAGAA